jgi:hypothetical protein
VILNDLPHDNLTQGGIVVDQYVPESKVLLMVGSFRRRVPTHFSKAD